MEGATPFIDTWWIWGIFVYAAGCPQTFLLTLSLLSGAAGLLLINSRKAGRTFLPAILLAILATIVLRERNHILGDSRLWMDGALYRPGDIPAYHEWLPTRLFNVLGGWLRDPGLIEWTFSLISSACGVGLAVLLARFLAFQSGNPADRRTTAVAWALALLQPMSFIFYGHVESYALFAVALAWVVSNVCLDLKNGRLRGITVFSFLLAGATHVMGLLLLPAIVAAVVRARGKSVRFALVCAAAVAAAGASLVFLSPTLRWYTIANGKWSVHISPGYVTGVLNGWAFAFLPFFILAWRRRRVLSADPTGLFLLLAFVACAVLPFVVTMVLGMYSDLDLLSPAAVIAAFLIGRSIVSEAPSRPPIRLHAAVATGLLLLTAWLTLGRCDRGFLAFENQLRRPTELRSGRAYGYEILAHSRHDRGNTAEAIRLLRDALEFDPGSLRLWGPLGRWQLEQGDTLQAIASLEKSLGARNSQRFEGLLAQLYVQRGRARDAIQRLADDPDWNVTDASRAAALAVAYLKEGKPDSSLSVSLAALAHNPSDAISHFNAGVAYVTLGNIDDALKATSAAVDLQPGNRNFQLQMCRLILARYGSQRLEQYLERLPEGLRDEMRRMTH